MNGMKKMYGLLAPFLLAAATGKTRITATENGTYRTNNSYKENNSLEAKGLHTYKCNGFKFYAHNEKEALKRAKLRGYWKPNSCIVEV
jgi:hypothetical protein